MPNLPEGALVLNRGGILLPAGARYFQYGAVTETIKDTMVLPCGVPTVFILPRRLFAPERNINLAEIEFPLYFNFFVKGTRTIVLCQPGQSAGLRHLVRQSLFGPSKLSALEFAQGRPAPNLLAEMRWLNQDLGTREVFRLEDLLDLREFGPDGLVQVDDEYSVCMEGPDQVAILERGRVVTRYHGEPPLPSPVRLVPPPSARTFRAPRLGVSVIGAGHGFDPGNRTSGFVVWINGAPLLVDPPVDSGAWLSGYDMDAREAERVLLTHCHADHDAGTLQKVLQEGRVCIYTTHSIIDSFVEKYSPLLGMRPSAFRDLFEHIPVEAEVPTDILGAQLTLHYSLHSVPCVGFELEHRGRSLAYPSDTLNDPTSIRQLRDLGVVSQERAIQLAEMPWHHDLILHEAGFPPIHTPVRRLAGLDDAIKDKLYLVHVSSQMVPEDSGLRIAPTGLEQTLDLDVPAEPTDESAYLLDVLGRVEIFRELPLERAGELLRSFRRETFRAGERIVAEGTPGDRFYVVLSGWAVVRKNGVDYKHYSHADYFGESALVTGKPRVADIFAHTDVELFSVERARFLHLLRGTRLVETLTHLAWVRTLPSWELLLESELCCNLTSNQMTQLQSFMEETSLPAGSKVEELLLIAEGSVAARWEGRVFRTLEKGAVAGELHVTRIPPQRDFVSQTEVRGYHLPRRAMLSFLRKNPGVRVRWETFFRFLCEDGRSLS